MENSVEIVKYDESKKNAWNNFIDTAKNGLFLFNRSYMDYHSDRFTDHSLMFMRKGEMIAAMPATVKDSVMTAHAGLTFGGVVSNESMKTPLLLEVFRSIKEFLKIARIEKLVYKAIPYIYHDLPADEDVYALFVNGARLFRRDVSSTVLLKADRNFNKGRRWSIKKARHNGIEIIESMEFRRFMVMEELLLKSKYNVNPVHTGDEMQLLAARFPENIKLFVAEKNGNMIAGAIIYESRNVAHLQYVSASDDGKKTGALDLLMEFLLNRYCADKKYFDFGISTENDGRFLNRGLIDNKEGFGGRAVVYDFYEMTAQ